MSNNLKPQELPPAVKFITLLASVFFRNDRGYYGDEKRVIGGLFYIKMPGGAPPPESPYSHENFRPEYGPGSEKEQSR